MFRRILCGVVSVGVVLLLAAPARAGEHAGSIRVTLQNGETVVPDGSVELYYAGIPANGDFRLTEEFGGGLVRSRDALSPALAKWLGEMAGEGERKRLDEEGSALFSDLPQGLYLLRQREPSTGYHLMEPMLVTLPCEYQWHLRAYPMMEEITREIPLTGQPMAPMVAMAALPASAAGILLCCRRRRR